MSQALNIHTLSLVTQAVHTYDQTEHITQLQVLSSQDSDGDAVMERIFSGPHAKPIVYAKVWLCVVTGWSFYVCVSIGICKKRIERAVN